jgi:hypothetical protein
VIYTAHYYNLDDQIEKNKMGVALAGIGERSAYRVYVEKPEEKRPHGRPRHR